MKRSIGPKTIVYPHPVFLVGSFDAIGQPNVMAASWGGICCSKPPAVAVSLRAATHTHGNITARKAFTVAIPSTRHVRETDFVGIYSGRKGDKFAATGLTPVHAEHVDAPYPDECPLVLECRLLHTHELGMHTQFVGEIVDVKADQKVLGDNGLPDITRVDPLIYASGNRAYFGVGELVARAFSVGVVEEDESRS